MQVVFPRAMEEVCGCEVGLPTSESLVVEIDAGGVESWV